MHTINRAKALLVALLSLIAFGIASVGHAQVPDNRGTDFWIGFPLNYNGHAYQTLFIGSDVDGKAIVEIPGLSFRQEVDFVEGTISSLVLPRDVQHKLIDTVGKLGIHVTSTTPVTLYGLSQERYTTDAFLALPTNKLGTEYMAVSYSGTYEGSQLYIVGAENATTVEITPAAKSAGREAGVPYAITLQQGETYLLTADDIIGDLTGSIVKSDKPVAVFSGHKCTVIPQWANACDFLIEQLPPTPSWGKQFITVPLASRRNGDPFRIVAAENDTQVYLDNGHFITLQRGEYHEFTLKQPSLIEADKPLLVAQYANSLSYDNASADPFMALLTPVGQYLSHYLVSTPATGFSTNYLNIVIPAAVIDSLKLDGQAVSATFTPLEGTRYLTAQLPVTAGQHVLEADAPFSTSFYGFNTYDSYGYPAGTALRDLSRETFQPLSCLNGVTTRSKPGNIQLSWSDTAAASYAVYRSENFDGPYVKIGETTSRYSTFLDTQNLTPKRNYYYRIDELDENGEVQCTSSRAAGYHPEEWNVGETINRAPHFRSTPETSALLNKPYSYTAIAVDPDGDALTYRLMEAPDGVAMSADGVLTWTPDTTGRFAILLQVSDPAGALALQSFELSVRDGNHAPVITSAPILTGDAGLPYRYQVVATDVDGDALTYSSLSSASGLSVDAATGLISWEVPPSAAGQYAVKVLARDASGATAQQKYLLDVTPNKAPVVTSTPVTLATRNVPYQYQMTAYDPEGEPVSYAFWNTPPNGMTVDSASGLIEWPDPYLGTHLIEVIVSDGVIETLHRYYLQVDFLTGDNRPPQITGNPGTQVRAGTTYTFTPGVSDPDRETVTLSLKQHPAAMTLTGLTLSWPATVADIGLHAVEIEAADPRGGTATLSWVIEVVPATLNRAPVVNSVPVAIGTAGSTYAYQINAVDPDGDPLIYTLEEAPAGMTVSTAGKVEWAIPAGTAGSFAVEIKVADDKGAYTRQVYTIGIGRPANQPPRITSQAVITGTAGSTYVYQISATDPERDPISYTLNQQPAGMTISSSGRIEWTIPAGTIGTFDVEIEASDGRGGIARQIYVIGVSESGNRAPLINSQPPVTGTSGVDYAYQVVAVDADGDVLSYALLSHPAGMTISPDGKLEWAIPSDLAGEVDVEIEVSDGRGGAAQQGYVISVAGSGNRAPRIFSWPVTTANIGSLYVYQIAASDADGDALTYALTVHPSGMTVSAAGKIEWTASVAQNGYHDVVLTVSDGRGGVATQTYTVYAQRAANRPPRITSDPVYRTKPGVAYQYNVLATDPDGDALTYSLTQGPAGMTLSAIGLIGWNNPLEGRHDVVVTVSDVHGASVSQSYVLQVGINSVPRILSVPVTTATVGNPYRYEVQASDADGDFLTYQLVSRHFIEGMTVSAEGVIEWLPTSVGGYEVTIRVSDGLAWQDQSYVIAVKNSPAGGGFSFVLQALPTYANIGESVVLQAFPEGGTPPYTVTHFRVNNVNMTPDANHSITYTPTVRGKHTVSMIMRDSKNVSIAQEAVFWVNDGGDTTPPLAEITAPARSDNINVAEITTVTDIVGTAFDDNLAEYLLHLSPAGEERWTRIGGGSASVTDGKLGTLNPQTLVNGLYDLRLIVIDTSGNQSGAKIGVILSGEQKIGQFALSFTDFDIEVGGLPLQLTRTYDTRRQFEALDFGYGWSVDYQNVKIQTNGIPGWGWELVQTGVGVNLNICPRPYGTRMATIRLPDGSMEKFDIGTEPQCRPLVDQNRFFEIRFDPRAGTTSTLEATDLPDKLLVDSGQNGLVTDEQQLANPQQFKLTAKDGTIYYLDKTFGIRKIQDRFGNTLTYTRDGILHSEGASLQFTRDAEDRITTVTAPDGRVRHYAYDGAGNLEEAADPQNQGTRFVYETKSQRVHQLDEIYGADGNRLFKAQFDSEGRLTSQIDGRNISINLTHDTGNNRDMVKNRNGHTTTYLYDDRGNITEVTDAYGHKTLYGHDAFGNETSVTDPLGHTIRREYDTWGNVVKETDPLGFSTLTDYNADGNPTRIVDELGRESVNHYALQTGALTRIVDAAGNGTDIGYTVKGDLASVADPLGNTTRYGYATLNGNRLMTTQTDAAGNVTRFEYDEAGNQTARKQNVTLDGVVTELVTRTAYDGNGNILSETDAAGRTTVYQYNSLNQLVRETDPQGRITQYGYDQRGLQTSVTYPDGSALTLGYDYNHNETHRCKHAVCTYTGYDALDRPVIVKDNMGAATLTEYDAAGRAVKETDALGHATQYEYDAAGRQIKQTDALGHETASEYDAVGNLVKRTDARGNTTEYVYNDRNQRIRTTLADGSVIEQGYDAAGRKVSDTDAEGHRIRYGYDALGQLTQVTDALDNTTSYGYDERGMFVSQTDAENRTTRFGYDAVGQRIGRTLPGGQRESWHYDVVGQLVEHIDFNGQSTRHEYDGLGRIIKTYRPDGRIFSYGWAGPGGFISGIGDSSDYYGGVSYNRDSLGRVLSRGTKNGVLRNNWNANGGRTELTVDNLGKIQYGYDELNRVDLITAPNGGETRLEYDALGNRTRIVRANGAVSLYVYNEVNQLTGIEHRKADDTLLASFAYTLDRNGRRIQAIETIDGQTRTVGYAYDAAGKLLQEKMQEGMRVSITDYAYDAVGNRLSKTVDGLITAYQYDANDQLVSETTGSAVTRYGYDLNGNLIRKETASGEIRYGWNSDNKLIAVDDRIAGISITYRYDPEGHREAKIVKQGGTTTAETYYRNDIERPYSEIVFENTRIGNGPWQETSYLHTPDGVGELLSQTQAGQIVHFYQDGQGSTRLTTDDSQTVKQVVSYDAFGNLTQAFGRGTTLPSNIRHLYTGEHYDHETGLYHLRARDYDPSIGRFTARDEFEGARKTPVTLNSYAYGNADPVNNIDPSGHFSFFGIQVGSTVNMLNWSYSVASIAFDVATGNAAGAVEDIAGELICTKFGKALCATAKKVLKKALGVFCKPLHCSSIIPKLDLSNSATGGALTKNLELMGIPKPSGSQAHHIVGGVTDEGKLTRQILAEHGITVNSPANGVFLPGCKNSSAVGMIHCGKHTREYEQAIATRLNHLTRREDILSELFDIRRELLSNSFTPLNMRSIQ